MNVIRCLYLWALLKLLSVFIVEVEPQYSGASIEGDTVTLDFVKKMMDDFKNQKCLHKRYDYKDNYDLSFCDMLI